MFPNGNRNSDSSFDLYTRNVNPSAPPIGVPETTTNTDTITYQNYLNGGQLGNQYGLINATQAEQDQLSSYQDQLNSIAQQMMDYTTQFSQSTVATDTQLNNNYKGMKNYLQDISLIDKDIKHFNTNVDNILKDSDIVVLQSNYTYLFWSILAVATVLISINVVKK